MGRTLDEMMASLPEERRRKVDARAEEIEHEILELRVELPGKGVIRLTGLGELHQ